MAEPDGPGEEALLGLPFGPNGIVITILVGVLLLAFSSTGSRSR